MKNVLVLVWIGLLALVAVRYLVRLLNHAFGWRLLAGIPSLQKPPDQLEQSIGLAAIVFVLVKGVQSALANLQD